MKEDLFKNLKKEVLEIKDRNPQITDDNAFVAWYLRAFITEDEKQAIDSLTGKSGDKGSDAIYFDHQNRMVFVVQGKYHIKINSTESRSNIVSLADLGRSILLDRSEAFKSILNNANAVVHEKLKEARNLIHNRDYKLILRYVTTGKISYTNIEEGEARIEEYDNASFETYSYKDLMIAMQDYIEGASPAVPSISLPVEGSELFTRTDSVTGITSWIFTMSGTDVGNIFNNIGVRLFARNIRGYLGNTEINRVMNHTIEKEPEYFWYYNNGITIVCDEAKQVRKGKSNIIKVTNAQIINGQQTTRTLALSGKNDVEVLVKLIEISRKHEENIVQYSHLVSEIVSATNWQNAISQSDLKSNDAEQIRIEKELKKLDYYYIRKRMSKSEAYKYGAYNFSFSIKKEELARAVAATTVDPYEIRLGKDRLFEDDIYSKIFNGRKASDYISIYWLYRFVNYWSKNDDRKVSAKWHVLNLIWNLLEQTLTKNSYRDQFRKMVERESRFIKDLLPLNKMIIETFKLSISFYKKYRVMDGKRQEARDFYKHKNLHGKLLILFNRPSKYRTRINSQVKNFITNIEAARER